VDATPDCTLPESSAPSTAEASVPCHCASQIVTRINSKTTFSGLDQWEEYFPMIARVEDLSIFGAPLAPVTPKAPTEIRTASRTHTINPVTDSTLQNAAEAQVVDDCDEDTGFFANNINNEDEDGEGSCRSACKNRTYHFQYSPSTIISTRKPGTI
jgi:hypothetical protein